MDHEQFQADKTNFINANLEREDLSKKLESLVSSSNGALRGFHIFETDINKIYPNGRRYPKRKIKYNPDPLDKAIYVGGQCVGYLKAHIPWLNANTWKLQKGLGIMPSVLPATETFNDFVKSTNQPLQA